MKHSGSVGMARENLLAKVLEPLLPGRIGMTSGKVVGITGRESSQADIIFFDKNECPRFLISEDPTIVPSLGVYGIIEVKSVLTASGLREDLKKLHRFRKLYDNEPANLGFKNGRYQNRGGSDGISFAISFSYSSKISDETIRKIILDEEKDVSPTQRASCVVVLDRSIVSRVSHGRPVVVNEFMGTGEMDVGSRKLGRGTLFQFYSELTEMIAKVRVLGTSPALYRRITEDIDGVVVSGQIVDYDGDDRRMSSTFLRSVVTEMPKLEAISVTDLEQKYADDFGIQIKNIGVGTVRVFRGDVLTAAAFVPRVLPGMVDPIVTLSSAFRTLSVGDDLVLVPRSLLTPEHLTPRI